MIMTDQKIPGVLDDIFAMYRTNFMGFASFTLLVWDHVDTFVAEVEYIWKGRKTLLVYLFLINRYLTPLGFMVNLFAYLSPVWTPERCTRFIRFEGSMTVVGINIVALMMFLRVYALYKGRNFILGVVIFIYLCQLSVNAWLLTKGVAVAHNPQSGVHACTMIFDPSISAIASSSAWLPLLYDTVVLGLTLNRTIPSLRNRNTFYIMKRLLEDGLIYYTAIFSVTAVLTIMIIAAPPDIKNISAQLELLLTVTMMSRITLNLKRSVKKLNDTTVVRAELPSIFTQRSERIHANRDIKIITPGFNDGYREDEDEDELEMRSRENLPMPIITVVNPGGKRDVLTSRDKFDEEVASWGDVWGPLNNHTPMHIGIMDPIQEVESGDHVRFQAGIRLDPKDVS
ncbi:hypothetical protein CPB84DRAFT_1773281 [Gymnopilus junonius]|uniref:DUF6533 domain-containing protein n=1 Tax=Gymnopilus junonius TaxID=109634 RepID=A0A9P5TQP7_GYMJU|nr:hypothetical protein CPB84DRAFT_1773281 [Gymnopilus junonius]